jgi:hypothetical protein
MIILLLLTFLLTKGETSKTFKHTTEAWFLLFKFWNHMPLLHWRCWKHWVEEWLFLFHWNVKSESKIFSKLVCIQEAWYFSVCRHSCNSSHNWRQCIALHNLWITTKEFDTLVFVGEKQILVLGFLVFMVSVWHESVYQNFQSLLLLTAFLFGYSFLLVSSSMGLYGKYPTSRKLVSTWICWNKSLNCLDYILTVCRQKGCVKNTNFIKITGATNQVFKHDLCENILRLCD